MKEAEKPVLPANADVAADGKGRTVKITPESRKRLLELENELEHTIGSDRARVQREIDKLKNTVQP